MIFLEFVDFAFVFQLAFVKMRIFEKNYRFFLEFVDFAFVFILGFVQMRIFEKTIEFERYVRFCSGVQNVNLRLRSPLHEQRTIDFFGICGFCLCFSIGFRKNAHF